MKRTPLTRKTPMKKDPGAALKRGWASGTPRVGKRKKGSVSKAKKAAWAAMSRYIRLRDSFQSGGWELLAKCVTCGKIAPITGKGCIQAGHFIAGRGNVLLYDEDNCHVQCVGCNMWQQGRWADYYEFMVRKFGQERTEELIAMRHSIQRMTAEDHLAKEQHFLKKIEDLGGWPVGNKENKGIDGKD